MNDRRGDSADHDEERDRFVRQQLLSENEQRERGAAEQERGAFRLADVLEENVHALPEITVPAFHTEELRQLRAREVQRDAGFEADHHAFRDEIHRRARARQPRDERDRAVSSAVQAASAAKRAGSPPPCRRATSR
jgi:hypothetical protein